MPAFYDSWREILFETMNFEPWNFFNRQKDNLDTSGIFSKARPHAALLWQALSKFQQFCTHNNETVFQIVVYLTFISDSMLKMHRYKFNFSSAIVESRNLGAYN